MSTFLEVIEYGSTRTNQPPLLFIHGGWHGAWCWEEYFLPYFAQRGYHCMAMSLRGHGGSSGRDRIESYSIEDYVTDIADVVAGCRMPPIVIAHSFGGLLAQRYIVQYGPRPLSGLFLIATLPYQGILQRLLCTTHFLKHPLQSLQLMISKSNEQVWNNLRFTQKSFFSKSISESSLRNYMKHLQKESSCVMQALLTLKITPITVDRLQGLPVGVMGALFDRIVPESAINYVATSLGVQAIFAETAHDMMLDTNWLLAAEHLLSWLQNLS